MKTRRKGTEVRTKCANYLKKQGYLVDVVEKTGKFVKIKDMFGLFDLVAVHKDYGIKFIQVTCTRPHSLKPYKDFHKKYGQFKFSTEQWVWIKRKGFKVYWWDNTSKCKHHSKELFV